MNRKMLLVGEPKSAGKTTFLMSAPQPILVFSFDLGGPSIPPGVDPVGITFIDYPAARPIMSHDKEGGITSDQWLRPSKVGSQILQDMEEVYNAFQENRSIILRKKEISLPRTIGLDGLTELQAVMLDWVCAVNHEYNPEDFENSFVPWGKRLNTLRAIFHMIIPLPCHVVMTAWETQEMKSVKGPKGKIIQEPTGRFIPDIGGKLDNITPGKVAAVLRCYVDFSQGLRYLVQAKPDPYRTYSGIRDSYAHPEVFDVTVRGKPGELLPWQKVFGTEDI